MTPEELLKPRYKVKADYPLSHMYFDVGDILTWNGEYFRIDENVKMAASTVRSFPHLFKKLEWWEDRKIVDMPEYLKVIEEPGKGKILRVSDYQKGSNQYEFIVDWENLFMLHVAFTIPATESEYLNQSK